MIDRLVVGRASKRAIAGLHPVGQCKLVLLRLDVVLSDELGLRDDEIGIGVGEDLGYGFMIMTTPSAQQRLVGRILDECMAENERVPHHTANDDELGGHELMQRL